jgi:hypothetical protein
MELPNGMPTSEVGEEKAVRSPSATETINGISASMACKIASAASKGGTKTDVAKGLSSLAAF